MNEMLDQYVYEHRSQLVDELDAEVTVVPLDKELLSLANELVRLFPMKHGDVVGQMDKAHVVWARCLRDALCLGRLSEAKRRREVYSDEICTEIERSISKAFIIGRQYAPERP